MPKNNARPYSFKFTEEPTNTYLFTTDHGAAYAIRFKFTPYLFENHPDISDQVYELVVERIRPAPIRADSDPAIAVTVATICEDFVSDKERILLYICETADARHLARVRKFDAWFREFNDFGFLKLDANFPDVNDVTYCTSLIFRWTHPQRHLIMDEFEVLAKRYNTDK